jgi:tetratricopeptide (TPR) repeat protein
MKSILLASAVTFSLAAGAAMAAGGGDETAPTKPKCKSGEVYDKKTKSCVSTSRHNLDTDALYENLRELAYAGRYDDAKEVLAQMPADDDRTLTYYGFVNRKLGDMDAAMTYYARALEVNPANILARSYMGQGFVTQGKMTEAIEQLRAIWDYDGKGTWAEASLRDAIQTGTTYNY